MQSNTFQTSFDIDCNLYETSISMLPAQNLLYCYNLHSKYIYGTDYQIDSWRTSVGNEIIAWNSKQNVVPKITGR